MNPPAQPPLRHPQSRPGRRSSKRYVFRLYSTRSLLYCTRSLLYCAWSLLYSTRSLLYHTFLTSIVTHFPKSSSKHYAIVYILHTICPIQYNFSPPMICVLVVCVPKYLYLVCVLKYTLYLVCVLSTHTKYKYVYNLVCVLKYTY